MRRNELTIVLVAGRRRAGRRLLAARPGPEADQAASLKADVDQLQSPGRPRPSRRPPRASRAKVVPGRLPQARRARQGGARGRRPGEPPGPAPAARRPLRGRVPVDRPRRTPPAWRTTSAPAPPPRRPPRSTSHHLDEPDRDDHVRHRRLDHVATSDPTAVATEASAATLPIGAAVGPAGLPVMPYELKFTGLLPDRRLHEASRRDGPHAARRGGRRRPPADRGRVQPRADPGGDREPAGPDADRRPDGDHLPDAGRPGGHRRRHSDRAPPATATPASTAGSTATSTPTPAAPSSVAPAATTP